MEKIIEEIQAILGSLKYYVDLEVQKKTEERDKEITLLKTQIEVGKEQLKGKEEIILELKSVIDFMREKRGGKENKKEDK